MPSIDYTLPHWLYWVGVLTIPLVLMYLHKRGVQGSARTKRQAKLSLAYLFWVSGGIFGLHRIYLRSYVGLLFLPLVGLLLYFNSQYNAGRDVVSQLTSDVRIAESDIKFYSERLRDPKLSSKRRHESQAKLDKAHANKKNAAPLLEKAEAKQAVWPTYNQYLMILIGLWLLIDAFLLPRMVRRCIAEEPVDERKDLNLEQLVAEAAGHHEPTAAVHSRMTDLLDRLSDFVGVYVSYWTVIAVFVYYYEVVLRYFFNSPSSWTHESAFLLLGMQYLLAGVYGFKENALVSVDIIYVNLSRKVQSILDIISSTFFFLFVVALIVTGWTFLEDAYVQHEVTMNEWGIAYWPVKSTIVIGSVLLLLQGLSKLAKDILFLWRGAA